MTQLLVRAYKGAVRLLERAVPRRLRLLVNAEGFSIRRFMKSAAREVKPPERVLDAGAGNCPYKALFARAAYESTDLENSGGVTHTFTCDLHQVPRPDNTYDAIICTQTINQLEVPEKGLSEFYRLLKPGGRLYMTVGMGWPNLNLHKMLTHAGFRVVFIKPRGGMFWRMGHLLREMPSYIMSQYKDNLLAVLCLAPFYLVGVVVLGFLVPLVCHYIDWLDKRQSWTLGYACSCVKDPVPAQNG
jgi:SAM-dependent methyltransferase